MSVSDAVKKILQEVAPRNKRGLLTALVDAHLVLLMDSECVDSIEDYRHVIAKIDRLVEGALSPASIELAEGNPRRMQMSCKGAQVSAELNGDTDYIDAERLITALNDVLRRQCEKQLWIVWDREILGQDLGIAFATRDERNALWHHGLPIAEDETGTRLPSIHAAGEFAGRPAIGFTDGETDLEHLVMQLAGLTSGFLNIRKVEIDRPNEMLRLVLDAGRIEVTTDSSDEGFFSIAEYPEGAVVEAMNKVLAQLGSDRVFCSLFGPRNNTWHIVFVTPQEDRDLRNQYN